MEDTGNVRGKSHKRRKIDTGAPRNGSAKEPAESSSGSVGKAAAATPTKDPTSRPGEDRGLLSYINIQDK